MFKKHQVNTSNNPLSDNLRSDNLLSDCSSTSAEFRQPHVASNASGKSSNALDRKQLAVMKMTANMGFFIGISTAVVCLSPMASANVMRSLEKNSVHSVVDNNALLCSKDNTRANIHTNTDKGFQSEILNATKCTESSEPVSTTLPPTETDYKRYRNEQFDYSVLYPAELLILRGENEEGETIISSDEEDILLKVYAVEDSEETLSERYEQAQLESNITYRTIEDNDFFVVSGSMDGTVFYRKTFLEDGIFKVLELQYDQSLQPEFGAIASVIGDSFAPLQTGAELAQLPPEVQTAILDSAANNTEAESAIFEIVSVEQRTWSDGCLELAQTGEVCTQALVPGWRVRLEAEVAGGVRSFTYRTDETGEQLRFE